MVPLLAIGLLMTGCYENAWEDHVAKDQLLKNNLVEAIGTKAELSTFLSMLKKTGYDKVLESANSLTVFAPANSAWTGIDTTNVDQMRKVVGALIVYKSYFTDNSKIFGTLKSVNGKNISYDSETQTFNGAKIINPDIRTANGVIHITDKIVERKDNIWEFLSGKTDNSQYIFINSLNKKVMDPDKSIAVRVGTDGKTIYDTVWMNINNFLKKYPIDNEDSTYTYIVVENEGFNMLYNKYKNYFKMATEFQTDSTTRFNVCQDMVFKGVVDITQFDTLTNVDGVKVPVNGVTIKETYNSSNGRVYVINQTNIRLKDKIKPIKIEGEAYSSASDANYVFTRYKLWASGERDIAMAGGETQTDTIYRRLTGVRDSIVSKTYFVNSNLVANINNFSIAYKANVNSTNYDIYYVAYDDIADHFDPTYTNFGVYKIVQKLFISMPGGNPLKYGITDNARGVANNYLGEARCFVGQGMAGVHEITKLKQWNLVATTQLLDIPVTTANADVMTVPKTGTLTMWLCNTARSNTASRHGLIFLDYILLVPRIVEE
ncbi:MAG TPA: fasciclin domain-containing protein [Paludibacter sp.]